MRKPTHNITGHYYFNEQVKYIHGKAAITEEGYLEAIIFETPEKQTCELQGAVMVLDDVMVIDAMEAGEENAPRIFYYLEKEIKKASEADFEGTYVGVRHKYQTTGDIGNDKWPEITTPEVIREMVKSIRIVGEEKKHAAVMELRRIKGY